MISVGEILDRGAGRVHMVGVCGVGMAGLAVLLKGRGFEVSGCDLVLNNFAGRLRDYGVTVLEGHDAAHINDGVDWVVRSAAVPDDTPEIAAALGRGVPVFCRGEVLPALLKGRVSIAVSGTHGKTTTSSFIAQVLKSAGRSPSWCIGGEIRNRGGVDMGAGENAGAEIVVEADESDGTVALYRPDIAVVTNIEYDHMEHFESAEAFAGCFKDFINHAGRAVVYCADDAGASSLMQKAVFDNPSVRVLSYGFSEGAGIVAGDVVGSGSSQRFKIYRGGELAGELGIPVPGRHNILNVLAAYAVCMELGLSFEEIKKAVAGICLPDRRFEIVAEKEGIVVVSDYAHHPTEIRALIDAVRGVYAGRRIVGVFQPHRYTRTLALGADFPQSFSGLNGLILCPVYAASEKPLKGGTTWDLYKRFRDEGVMFDGHSPMLADNLEQAWGYLRRNLKAGDVLLVIGAGDVEKIAGWAGGDSICVPVPDVPNSIEGVIFRTNEEMGRKTTLGTGGVVDVLAEVSTVAGLRSVMEWVERVNLPVSVVGSGSNLVVGDLGVRGLVVRLSGGEFAEVGRDPAGHDPEFQPSDPDSGVAVRVGAGVSVAHLLGWLESEGLTGLEFLEGVPGSVGGILRMNAGSAGHEICERVLWISCLKKDGLLCTLKWNEIEWDYRCCLDLQGVTVIEAGLYLDEGDREEIRGLREKRAERRSWMRGLRSAGSFFKNPGVGDLRTGVITGTAGALIDRAGLKEMRVGGAVVCPSHANFILAEDGATGSDVKALMHLVKAEIFEKFGIELENEVVELG